MQPVVRHTLTLYEILYANIPPLVPENIVRDMHTELTRLKNEEDISLEEVESSIAIHGKELWPYIKAFEEMMKYHEHVMGDKIFTHKASPGLRKKYTLISKLGGGYNPVKMGRILEDFDHDEKRELNELLVDLKRDVRRYAMQSVLTHDRRTYEEKIEYYGAMIEEVNRIIQKLEELAEKHKEIDPILSEDIISKIRAIEQSFTFVGPEMDMDEIRSTPEYYEGRRAEKKMRWGK